MHKKEKTVLSHQNKLVRRHWRSSDRLELGPRVPQRPLYTLRSLMAAQMTQSNSVNTNTTASINRQHSCEIDDISDGYSYIEVIDDSLYPRTNYDDNEHYYSEVTLE